MAWVVALEVNQGNLISNLNGYLVQTRPLLAAPSLRQLIQLGGQFIPVVYGTGQLTNSFTQILQTSSDVTTSYVKKFTLFNTSSSIQVVELRLAFSGLPTVDWQRIVLGPNESADVIDIGESILLNPGDSILARSTSPDVVDYYLAGVDELPDES